MDYGKVTFVNLEEGESFLKEAEQGQLKIDDCVLQVKNFSMKESELKKGYNLLIYNFPPQWNSEQIKNFLHNYLDQKTQENMTISQSKKKSYTVKISVENKSESKQIIEKLNGELISFEGEQYSLVCTKFLNKKNLAI